MIKKVLTIFLSMLLVSLSLYGCSKEKPNQIKEAVVTITKDYNTDDENIQRIEANLKKEGKSVYQYDTENVNIVLVIQTTGQIKDITINTIDFELYEKVKFDLEEYHKINGKTNGKKIEDLTLNKDNALILKTNEPDTIPLHYLTFKDELNNIIYYEVAYNGMDDYTGIDEIKINIR